MRLFPKKQPGFREGSDWFNPILVKELRQGTRSRAFVWSFIALQTALLVLIVSALLSAASPHTNYDQDVVTGLFWTLIAIPLLLMLPGVGFGGIKKELDAKTLELIFLTRMTTLRIVAGKWAALIVQGLLFVAAILPYLILRYFLGGIDLVDELRILLVLLLASLCLTATAVGLSSVTSKVFRIGIALFALGAALQMLSATATAVFGVSGAFFRGGAGSGGFLAWLVPLFAVPLFIFLMLEFGAARIAPPAENHALRKRAAALALLAGCVVIHLGMENIWPLLVVVAIPLFFLCVEAVNESLGSYGIILRARRARGKSFPVWIRLFLAPGWPSGTVFTILVTGIYLTLLTADSGAEPEAFLVVLSLSGALLVPAALIRLTAPHTERSFLVFLLIQVVMICAGVSTILITETTNFDVVPFFQFIPIPAIVMLISGDLAGGWEWNDGIPRAIVAMGFVNVISILALLVVGARLNRQTAAAARAEFRTRTAET